MDNIKGLLNYSIGVLEKIHVLLDSYFEFHFKNST